LYAALLRHLADDAERGGPTTVVLAGHESDPRDSALPLRLMAALHRAVLVGRAPGLARHYPSVGGDGDPDAAWQALRQVLIEQVQLIRADLGRPCQTNDPGRSAALLIGILHAVRLSGLHRIRLIELGASGGLNLRVDRYRIGSYGPADSGVRLDVPPLPQLDYEIVDRSGCDPRPVDVATASGRLTLLASVWSDQVKRVQRLRAAFKIAQTLPVTVERAGGAAFLSRRLADEHPSLTVVWHSIVRQYVEPSEWAQIERLIARARGPIARVSMEPGRESGVPVEVSWDNETHRVAIAGHHGPPLQLLS
jgi:hypothetical protein